MNRLRTVAAIPAGSWTKWVVIGFLAGTFAMLATTPSTTLTARKPDPARTELGQERIAALAGEMAS